MFFPTGAENPVVQCERNGERGAGCCETASLPAWHVSSHLAVIPSQVCFRVQIKCKASQSNFKIQRNPVLHEYKDSVVVWELFATVVVKLVFCCRYGQEVTEASILEEIHKIIPHVEAFVSRYVEPKNFTMGQKMYVKLFIVIKSQSFLIYM